MRRMRVFVRDMVRQLVTDTPKATRVFGMYLLFLRTASITCPGNSRRHDSFVN